MILLCLVMGYFSGAIPLLNSYTVVIVTVIQVVTKALVRFPVYLSALSYTASYNMYKIALIFMIFSAIDVTVINYWYILMNY